MMCHEEANIHIYPSIPNHTFVKILTLLVVLVRCLRTKTLFAAAESIESQGVFPDTRHVLKLYGDSCQWTLSSSDGVYSDIPCQVPGDVLTDLHRAGIISDPYRERNFLTQRRIWMGDLKNDTLTPKNSTYPDLPELEQRTRTWTYQTQFTIPLPTVSTKRRLAQELKTFVLVLEGVKMGASVQMNGVRIGNTTDQFLRYMIPISQSIMDLGTPVTSGSSHASYPAMRQIYEQSLLHEVEWESTDAELASFHSLSISFDPSIETHGRFMACSGGWDWAPYSRAGDHRGSRVFSFGIFKPVYLVEVRDVLIVHVVPKIYYLGPYAREPMLHGPEGDFRLEVHVHLVSRSTSLGVEGEVVLRADFLPKEKVKPFTILKSADSYIVVFQENVSKNSVKLWWPNGCGEQKLYELSAQYRNKLLGTSTEWVNRTVGFRSVALVTSNETSVSSLDGYSYESKRGSGSHGMYFRVNGALIWARGANFVPMDQLEGRLTDKAHKLAVQSAAKANMNMLRVWGGGMVLPDSFYKACDEEGILLYHDMMFVEEQLHGPELKPEVENEIRFIVRELASHPSIVLWNGCNECTRKEETNSDIFSSFVMRIVADEDDTRSVWPSSPSKSGWKSGVFTHDGRPDGNAFSYYDSKSAGSALEKHGPYLHGFSLEFPTVNGHSDESHFSLNTPIEIDKTDIGPQFPNHFVSEFGASVYSSFESMAALLDTEHHGVHGGGNPDVCKLVYQDLNTCEGVNVMAERNYSCDRQILAYFGNADLESVGTKPFQRQLYQCMIGQAFWMKGEIELQRNSNSFGTLIWQLNENWPTGGWGLLEYGSQTKQAGQVLGGRWKPLLSLLERTLFRDVIASCGVGGKCFCRNDGVFSVGLTIDIEIWDLGSGKSLPHFRQNFALDGCRGATDYFSVGENWDPGSSALFITIFNENGMCIGENLILGLPPKQLTGLHRNANVSTSVVLGDDDDHAIVALQTNATVLYVALSTMVDGQFEDNYFHMKAGSRKTSLHGT